MTGRERNLWLVVAAVVVAFLAYRLFFGDSGSSVAEKTIGLRPPGLAEAESLLCAAGDIEARGKAAAARLADLEGRFFPAEQPEDEARAKLLRVVEDLAYRSMLAVEQKSFMEQNGLLKSEAGLVGVVFSGKTDAKSLLEFLRLVAEAKTPLVVTRLQIHSLPDQRLLSYQVAVSTLFLEKSGGSK